MAQSVKATVIAFVVSTLPAAGAAKADCLSNCLGSVCSGVNYNKDMYCMMQSNRCVVECRESGGRSPGTRNWRAIAASASTGDSGYSSDRNSRAEAEREALQRCGKADCEVAVWFWNRCGALAMGDDYTYGADSDPSEQRAQAKAVSRCRSEGGQNCTVDVSICTR